MPSKRKARRALASSLEMFAGCKWATLHVQAAFDEAVRKYSGRPTVTGVDLGYKWVDGKRTKTLAVRIHVREKHGLRALNARETFPRQINGVPVDVIEAVYENSAGGSLRTRVGSLRPSVSVGRLDDGAGTLGMFVLDERAPGEVGILSAAHVLFAAAGGPGDSIIQAGRDDGGTAADVVATVTRAFRQSDAAFARLTGARQRDRRVAISSARSLKSAAEARRSRVARWTDSATTWACAIRSASSERRPLQSLTSATQVRCGTTQGQVLRSDCTARDQSCSRPARTSP